MECREFKFFQQLFVRMSLLLGHSYSLARGLLFFLAGISFLVLTACAGGGGAGGSGGNGGPLRLLEVKLTFAPIPGGFEIGNQSGFGNFVSLNITAISGTKYVDEDINIAEFSDDSYNFLGLDEQSNYTFEIIGTLGDGGQQEVKIDFVWEENEEDHNNGGIRPGLDTDGDRRANSVDEDDDNDNVLDLMDTGMVDGRECRLHGDCDNDGVMDDVDNCRFVVNPRQDNRDSAEDGGDACDEDDDNDGVNDDSDRCSIGVTNWTSNGDTDNDGDGCLDDSTEDTDDDNDGLADTDVKERQMNSDNVRCSLLADCDGDTIRDIDEVAADCVTKADCDNDGAEDGDEIAGCVQDSDCDGDGEMDGADIDADGDGLIEIGTHEELNAIRYALNGSGSRSAESAALDTSGCGNNNDITSCAGYELVANISLATYADDEGGKGWQPLGHDIDGATTGCQGATFDGTFEGNGFMISDLNISRSGEDCVGLFGHIAADSEIRNLTLHIETVIGRHGVGGLVGGGSSARIVSSAVVVGEVRGSSNVGGLVGDGIRAQIHYSSVVVGVVRGSVRILGGLVGNGPSAQIFSSSVVAAEVSGRNTAQVGGLVGNGQSAQILSSSVVVSEVSVGSASHSAGGLVGDGSSARIVSSSVVVGEVSSGSSVGGLVADFGSGKVAYSYVVSGSNTSLTETGSGQGVASYWDSDTSGRNTGNPGEAKTSNQLRMPMDYTGIYDTWDDDTNIFSDGMSDEPLAVWCDKDKSGSIEGGEKVDDNRIWDFGGTNDYPAIRCTPIDPTEWRSWWSLDGNGKPQLNQMLLEEELNK